MARETPAADAGAPPTSQELLNRALRRSGERSARVARRRLWWRWTLWLLSRLVLWGGPPLVLVLVWWLWLQPAEDWPGATPSPSVAGRPAPAEAPSVNSASPSGLQLRLDDEESWRDPAATRRHQLPSPMAGERPAPVTPQEPSP